MKTSFNYKAKLSISRVDNGYIVQVIKEDVPDFKALYNNPTFVFSSYKNLVCFMGQFFTTTEPND